MSQPSANIHQGTPALLWPGSRPSKYRWNRNRIWSVEALLATRATTARSKPFFSGRSNSLSQEISGFCSNFCDQHINNPHMFLYIICNITYYVYVCTIIYIYVLCRKTTYIYIYIHICGYYPLRMPMQPFLGTSCNSTHRFDNWATPTSHVLNPWSLRHILPKFWPTTAVQAISFFSHILWRCHALQAHFNICVFFLNIYGIFFSPYVVWVYLSIYLSILLSMYVLPVLNDLSSAVRVKKIVQKWFQP